MCAHLVCLQVLSFFSTYDSCRFWVSGDANIETFFYSACSATDNILCCLVLQNGQTPLSLAENLNHAAVAEVLRRVTRVSVAATVLPAQDAAFLTVEPPESMQDTVTFDSDDEAGAPSGLSIFYYLLTHSVCVTA
jgi:hypothetical protein